MSAARRDWRDHWLLNWRVREHLCIRIVPGVWLPTIYHNRRLKHFSIVLPFLGITFDYE